MTKKKVVTIKGQPLPTAETPEQRLSELVRGLTDPTLSEQDRRDACFQGLLSEVHRAQCVRRPSVRRSSGSHQQPYSHKAVTLATDAVLRHLERKVASPRRKAGNE